MESSAPSADSEKSKIREKTEAAHFTELLNSFLEHQEELLHLAGFVTTHKSEIDNPKERGRARTALEFPQADPKAFEPVWSHVDYLFSDKSGPAPEADTEAAGNSGGGAPEHADPDDLGLTTASGEEGDEATGSEDEVSSETAPGQDYAAGHQSTEPSEDGPLNGLPDPLRRALSLLPQEYAVDYFATVILARTRPARGTPRLLSMLLTNLIGDFEVHIANLLRLLYRRNPGTVSSEKAFSLADVSKFADIEAFKVHVLDKAVDKVFFDSYSDWLKVFTEKFDLVLPPSAENSIILEAFQRRHVIVHNGGRVSQQYLDKVPVEYRNVQLGTELPVDVDYLQKVADNLFVVGMSLVCVAAFKQLKNEEDLHAIEKKATAVSYELLQAERYEPVREMTKVYTQKTFRHSTSALMWTINGWLAQKRLGRFGECRKAIEKWDTGTLEPMYKLAKLALLDEHDEALKIVEQIRGTKQLSQQQWEAWPLLRELRAYDLAQNAVKTEANEEGSRAS